MKKILFVFLSLVFLVSCSSDSDVGDVVKNNIIEINGYQYQIDVFSVNDRGFAIGTQKENTHALGLFYDSSHSITFNKKVMIKLEDIELLYVNHNDYVIKYASLSDVSTDSYYFVTKMTNGLYKVDVNLKTSDYAIKVNYVGKDNYD